MDVLMPQANPKSLYDLFKLAPDQAIKWFAGKRKNIESWNWFEVWQGEHAKAFTVAKSLSFDILADVRGATEQALKQGLTGRQYRALLTNKLKAKGWWGKKEIRDPRTGLNKVVQLGSPWRLNTIYQTNMQSSMMAGRWKAFYDNRDKRPYLQYVSVLDSLTRVEHAALNGKIFHINDSIWQKIYPPNGFNCRCRVRALTEKQALQRGYKPNQESVIPDGFPDDGFAHNNGTGQFALNKKLWSSVSKLEKNPLLKRVSTRLTDFIKNPIIVEHFINTVKHVLNRGKETGRDRENIVMLAGFLSGESNSILNTKHGVISLHERLLVGTKADRKKGTTQLNDTDWISLTDLMAKPKAILLEKPTNVLLYVMENEGRTFRIIIKDKKGNPEITSASYIFGLSQYKAGKYKLLSGSID